MNEVRRVQLTCRSLTCKGWRGALGWLVMGKATASLPISGVKAGSSSLLLLDQATTWLLEAALRLLGGLCSLLHHLRLQICH